MLRIFTYIFVLFLFTGCTQTPRANSHDPQQLTGKTWQWVSTVTPVERITAEHPERYTIRFAEDGQLQARFDCNRGGGSYKLSEGLITLGPMMSTRMACQGDTQDTVFMRDLSRVQSFFLEGEYLYLELPMDSGTMRFRPAP